jgi:hypothetical protein
LVSFFTEVCDLSLGVGLDAKACAFQGTIESACWWYPHKDFVMACERPVMIHRDAEGRWHDESGPAIAWPDGWGVHAIHGVRVPADVVEQPSSITVDRIEAERNAEVRRVMIQRIGLERYVAEAKFETVDEDRDQYGRPRRLLRRPMGVGMPDMVLVHVTNSSPEPDGTHKPYLLPVHPELRPLFRGREPGEPQKLTCHNAVASTFGKRG